MGEPLWKGLFEWSMRYQDGTTNSKPKAMAENDRKWLEEALTQHTVDLAGRMKDIKNKLDDPSGQELTVADRETLLDELLDTVENIDHARDFQTIGGLPTLLDLLEDPHPSLRWRAAEVVATCAQNHAPVQEYFVQQRVLPRLFKMLHDSDATCQTKSLLAISCIVRENSLALEQFRKLGGLQELVRLLGCANPRLQRKVLHLLQYDFTQCPSDMPAVCALNMMDSLCPVLTSEDNDLREAGLGVVLSLSRVVEARPYFEQNKDLEAILLAIAERCNNMDGGEIEQLQEEFSLISSIQDALRVAPTLSATVESVNMAVIPVMKKP